MITPLGTLDFDLNVRLGDAPIIFKSDDIPVAVATVVWEESSSRNAWQMMLKIHAASLPSGELPNAQLTDEPPAAQLWLAVSFYSELIDHEIPENRREAVTILWEMAMAIRRFQSLVGTHN